MNPNTSSVHFLPLPGLAGEVVPSAVAEEKNDAVSARVRRIKMVSERDGQVLCDDGVWRPAWASQTPQLRDYYDWEWGVPVRDERGVFEALSLEALMVGLSWRTVLHKREALRELFHNFEVERVAAIGRDELDRICQDPRGLRNWRKLNALVANAQASLQLRAQIGGEGLADLVWSYKPKRNLRPYHIDEVPVYTAESSALATDLRARGFSYVGPTNMYALMQAIGVVDASVVGSFKRGASGVWPS